VTLGVSQMATGFQHGAGLNFCPTSSQCRLGHMVNLAAAEEANGLIVDAGFFLARNGKWGNPN